MRLQQDTISSAGIKYDGEKPRYDLIPPSTLKALATILTFGANKYAARNWEKGIAWGRVFGALMRHLWAWWGRENKDPETGESHLWHAQCCLSFLIEYERTHKELDDRPAAIRGQLELFSPVPGATGDSSATDEETIHSI